MPELVSCVLVVACIVLAGLGYLWASFFTGLLLYLWLDYWERREL